MTERENQSSYWSNKLYEDSEKLGEEKKFELVKALLKDHVQLSEDEIEVFLSYNATNNDPENILQESSLEHLSAERKVANYFATYNWEENETDYQARRNQFLDSFTTILEGFYTEEELKEITNIIAPGDEFIATIRLVGHMHPTMRKVRNAYLPLITNVLEVGSGGVSDTTHTLFDGEKEPVDEIEDLLKGNSKDS